MLVRFQTPFEDKLKPRSQGPLVSVPASCPVLFLTRTKGEGGIGRDIMEVDCGCVISFSLFLAPESERRGALGRKSVGQASHCLFDLLICLFQTVRVWDVSTGSCLSSFNIGQSSASTVTTVSYDQVRDLEGFVRIVTRN